MFIGYKNAKEHVIKFLLNMIEKLGLKTRWMAIPSHLLIIRKKIR